MIVDVVQESQPDLEGYAAVPIAFDVREVMRVIAQPAGRFRLDPAPVVNPWTKDYDALDDGPRAWPDRFDVSRWAFFAARIGDERVGAAAVIYRAPDVDMLRGRDDVAVLWDIRVVPAARGRGVGGALLNAVEAWARTRGARTLEVETQNINAPACRFYARHGFELFAVDPDAYPDLPDETQLVWQKTLR
jgi:GNAT superfamily N-acetyltransferase